MPSITPTASTLTPSVPTRNSGSRLWIISEEMSINMLTKPSTQTPAGMRAAALAGGLRMPHCVRRLQPDDLPLPQTAP